MSFDFSYIDKAFINGSVVTVNPQDEICQAVGIKGNKIVFVGTTAELVKLVDEHTQIIDLKGRTMAPGFIDSHYHPILSGFMNGAIINATYPNVKCIDDLKRLIRERAAVTKKGDWIKLWGYDNNKLVEKRHPTMADLDEAAPEHPVQCMRTCGHVCIYNSLAFKAGNINTLEDLARFGKGEIEVKDGKFTGLTRDLSAFYLWSKVKYTEEELRAAVDRANQDCLKGGITSVHDCGECDAPAYSMMYRAAKEGWFKPRNFMMLHSIFGKPFSYQDNEHFLALGFHTGLGDEHFRIGSCKFMVDGGSSGPTLATREPYSHDPTLPRILSWEREEVRDYIDKINAHDCQATAHAEGDLAVEFMVEGYEYALARHYRKPEEHRHRIEHCVLTDQDLIDRMAKMGIVPITNPHFIPLNGSDYHRFFGERVNYLFALRSFIDAGLKPCLGCDAPTAEVDAIKGLDGAVNRMDRATGEVIGPNQRISMLEAIRCYTINGAYASFEDDIKGSIETGKLADFTIFDTDILHIDPLDIVKHHVDMTVIDGQICYERKEG